MDIFAFEAMEAEPLAVPEPGDPARRLHAQARARGEAGEIEAAYRLLRVARALDPADLQITADLAWAAEAMGHLEEAVELSELFADGVAAADPAAAAERYRECAAVVGERVGDLDRAATLLAKAASLRPGDESLRCELAALQGRREQEARPSPGRPAGAGQARPGRPGRARRGGLALPADGRGRARSRRRHAAARARPGQ